MPGLTPVNVPNPPVLPNDVPSGNDIGSTATAYPVSQRITSDNLVAPTAANKQPRSLEKRSYSLAVYLKLIADRLAQIDALYLRRHTEETQSALGLDNTTSGALGSLALNNHKLTLVAPGTASTDGVNKAQLDTAQTAANAYTDAQITILYNTILSLLALKVSKSGDTMTGNLTIPDGTAPQHAVTLAQLQYATAIISGNFSKTTPGGFNFVVPDRVYKINYMIVGAGGAGSRGTNYNNSGGGGSGGGGGGISILYNVAVSPGQVMTGAVGYGGYVSPGAPGSGNNGSGPSTVAESGGASNFNGLNATGGSGGRSGANGLGGASASGGTGTTGNGDASQAGVNGGGQAGGHGGYPGSRATIVSVTGLTPNYGNGSAGNGNGSTANGGIGSFGSGGGGSGDSGHGDTAGFGGQGGAGLVYIWWGS